MIVLGLTGSIGMGKSTTAGLFAARGVPVWDADAAVHRLYSPGGAAVAPVQAAFPGVLDHHGGIDRAALASALAAAPDGFRTLEAIVHPLVAADRMAFLALAEEQGQQLVVLDIPLLFETGHADSVDVIVVVTAPEDVRKARVMARPGMTEEKYALITGRQVEEATKRARADHVVWTDKGVAAAARDVDNILAQLLPNRSRV